MHTEIKNRIFIGGTGRSGAHAVASVIGNHPEVARIGDETHFIVDPGGLRELYDALTDQYDFYRASDAFFRFDELMRLHLAGKTNTIKRFARINRLFGESSYYRALDQFESALTLLEFDEKLRPEMSPENEFLSFGPSESTIFRRVVPRYFKNSEELTSLCCDFIESLFSDYAIKQGRNTWCELTPYNLFNMDFLWNLYPDATIIHMKRDPRGVAVSMKNQPWAPSDLDTTIDLLIPAYERWFRYKEQVPLTEKRYLEIKLEDLANHQAENEQLVFETCGVSPYRSEVFIDPEKAIWWHKALSAEEAKVITKRLEPYIVAMGYKAD